MLSSRHFRARVSSTHPLAAIALAVIAVFITALSGCAASGGTGSDAASASLSSQNTGNITNVEFEWIASSAAGSIKGTPDSFTLTMTGLNPAVVQYAERPQRFFDTITLEQLVTSPGLWLETDPPNAVLSFHTGDPADAPNMLPVVLSHPHWDAAAGTLTFDGKVLSDLENLPTTIQSVTAAIDGTYTQVTAVTPFVTATSVISNGTWNITFTDSNGQTCTTATVAAYNAGPVSVFTPTADCALNGKLTPTGTSGSTENYVTYSGQIATGNSKVTNGSWIIAVDPHAS